MPTNRKILPLPFKGGWSTSLGPQASDLTHFLAAENVYYELDGGFRKIPGAVAMNSTPLTESGTAITINTLFDYWKSGTAGSAVQKRMAYAGTQLWKEDLDGTWDSIKTGLEANKHGWFTQYNDLCIWSSTSNTDVPQKWNQTDATTSALGGTPPNFAFCIPHRGRLWAAGVASNPSRLYYSALDNPEDWVGAGSGSIDIDISDGDDIVGIASHKQQLWVFKGPNRGSISYISGSSPTGSDAFARVPFSRGVPCAAQQSILTYMNDLAWISTRGVHSLEATQEFGNMKEGFLSFPIQKVFLQESEITLDVSALASSYGVNHSQRGVLLWSVRQTGQAQNNLVLSYDYRFRPGRWSLLTAYKSASLAVILHNSQPRLFSGGYDGRALRHDEVNRNINGTSYTGKVRFPFLHYGSPDIMKQTAWVRFGIQPQGTSSLTLEWQNDEDAVQSTTVSQSSGAVLGGATGFTLDTDVLGGGAYLQRYFNPPGSYRVQQLTLSQPGNNDDMEIHEMAVQVEGAGLSEV